MGDQSEHVLVFRNDEFVIEVKATMDDETWRRMASAVMETLASPTSIIAFPTMSEDEHQRWLARWTAKR